MLAVVVAGLYITTRSLDIIEPGTRLRTLSFWESIGFLLDGLLFVLIGVQVPSILDRIDNADLVRLGGYSLLIAAVLLGVRALWVLLVPPANTSRQERIVIAWSGMRGGVSLAAALAIPVEHFPDRDLVLFVAYGAIVLTLVIPGVTLAPLIKRLGLQHENDERTPRPACASPKPRWSGSRTSPTTRPSTSSSGCATATARGSSGSRRAWRAAITTESDAAVAGRLLGEMIDAERDVLKAMRRERAFPADVLREIERELDLDESRLQARIRL